MQIDPAPFRVPPGQRAGLVARPTVVAPFGKPDTKRHLARHVARMAELQDIMAAARDHAVLVVLQAMDAGGKDGTVKHVFSGLNPQGCRVTSFKPPSIDEARHDFLWRTVAHLPARGEIGIFNRSYYEEVVTTRVHPHFLGAQRVAERPGLWADRFAAINAFERHLVQEGTAVVKLFLHISKEEQRRRLLARLDNPGKTWKFDEGDLAERDRWDEYAAAYEACLTVTGTEAAPWHVVPADDKPGARVIVGAIVLAAMEALQLRPPGLGPGQRDRVRAARARLMAEG